MKRNRMIWIVVLILASLTFVVVSGTVVAFYEGSLTGPELCRAQIPQALGVGDCMVVSCEADLEGQNISVFVQVDPDGATTECHENNNGALYNNVGCGNIPQ